MMSKKIYACFETQQKAKAAVNSLIKGGVHADRIQLKAKEMEGAGLNPAQNDYPMSERGGATSFSSAPPSAERDFNKGIEADDFNEDYRGDVDRDLHNQLKADQGNHPASGPAPLDAYANENLEPRGSEPGNVVNPDDQDYGAMASTFPDLMATGPGNAHSGDFAASLGTRTASIGATANASTHPGGMSDFLWSSLPTDFADYYRQQYEDGKTVLCVEAKDDDEQQQIEDHLRTAGAIKVDNGGFLA
jgi:hypothetical protein